MWAIIARSDARSNVPRASREDVGGGPSPATTSSGFVQRGSAVRPGWSSQRQCRRDSHSNDSRHQARRNKFTTKLYLSPRQVSISDIFETILQGRAGNIPIVR
jgi:hypothetical protein